MWLNNINYKKLPMSKQRSFEFTSGKMAVEGLAQVLGLGPGPVAGQVEVGPGGGVGEQPPPGRTAAAAAGQPHSRLILK